MGPRVLQLGQRHGGGNAYDVEGAGFGSPPSIRMCYHLYSVLIKSRDSIEQNVGKDKEQLGMLR